MSDACPSKTPCAVQMCMQWMMPGTLHVVWAMLASVHPTSITFKIQADLQSRQISNVLQFASEFRQLVLQLLFVAVQLQQLGCESGWIFSSWSVGCGCSVQVHKQLLVALHPLIQLLYILVLSNI